MLGETDASAVIKPLSKWVKKEATRQVAKALSAQNGDNDEQAVPMKTDDGDGYMMRQASKKKSGLD